MADKDPFARPPSLWAGLRASFLTGLIVVLPLGLTAYFTWAFIGWIDGWILPLIPAGYQPDALVRRLFGPEADFPLRGVGVLVFLLFTILIGWIAKGLIGRSLIRSAERMLARTPIIRSVYGSIKQITETFFTSGDKKFDRACLVQFPMPGVWTVGFVATKARGEVRAKIPLKGDVWTVFVAPAPNPTAGFVLYVEEKDLIFLDMPVEDAAKLIISAGLVYPGPKEGEAEASA